MRVLLDTDVVVAALRSDRGASRQLLLAALDRRITVLLSVPLILQYEAVLTRPDHVRALGLTTVGMGALLDALTCVSEPVIFRFLWRPQLKDPGDEMVLETAVNGHASHIAAFNLRGLSEAAAKFGVHAARPREILLELQGEKRS